MRYLLGIMIALALDAAVISGPDLRAPEQPRVCAEQRTADAAIGCLADAIQHDPYRRELWVALDRAIARSGRATITDAELTRLALRYRAAP
ncbi:MAG TPA: hypothetical protein VGQ18_13560 [Gemmatimonadales bacterium]|jgi:hypothetical protein|nr:hypothetical protein [Gemmatimonadales bacterium]